MPAPARVGLALWPDKMPGDCANDVDLNIHSVWSLLQIRPDLLRSGAAARALRESIRYAIRLAEA